MTAPGTVPGGPGCPELVTVRSGGGLHHHLLDRQDHRVLCRGLSSGTIRLAPDPLFADLFGDLACRRCIKAAVKTGYTRIITDDGPSIWRCCSPANVGEQPGPRS